MSTPRKTIISILVDNHPGVLTRVTSLLGRRGYNIDSLTVSITNIPDLSRITVVMTGDEYMLDQMIAQTSKLIEVKDIFTLDADKSLMRELLLVKVAADDSNRGVITEIANVYKAKVIDLSVGSMVLELTGEQNKIDGFLTILGEYEILEVCRTGVTALSRGAVDYHLNL
ncbi:acetolactate synthase small subunit [Bacilliculturomica massiliensis]|uniref:acetolactate synthase small subunit n=1 Tax=Bacilliculturomica massiliensis TaxID=1917867 RepID=UPI001030B962|nr:acetolactate synthase small subunit [Bacilliculturomica massiliensis]